MNLLIGTLLDVTSQERQWPSGDKFVEHTAHVLDGVSTIRVVLAPARDGRPGLEPGVVKAHNGERVCFDVYLRGHTNKQVYTTATRLLSADDVADALGLATV